MSQTEVEAFLKNTGIVSSKKQKSPIIIEQPAARNIPMALLEKEVFTKIVKEIPDQEEISLETLFKRVTEKKEQSSPPPIIIESSLTSTPPESLDPAFISTSPPTTSSPVTTPLIKEEEKIEERKESVKKIKGDRGDKGDKGDPGKTILLRKTDEAIEWKYTDEKDWRILVALDELRPSFPISPPTKMGIIGGGGGGHKGDPGASVELRTVGNELQWKSTDEEEWALLYILPSGGEEEMSYAKRIDNAGDYIYKGEAPVGATESDPVWRISRTYVNPEDSDIIILWAEGNSNFDNAWEDHLTLNYS